MSADVVKKRGGAFNVERRLVKLLSRNRANRVFRIPVSGSRSLPDLFLVNNSEGRVVAFEVKSTSGKRVRVRVAQVRKLFEFLDSFKKYSRREAVIAVWFAKEGKWVFKRVDGLLADSVTVSADEESDWTPNVPLLR